MNRIYGRTFIVSLFSKTATGRAGYRCASCGTDIAEGATCWAVAVNRPNGWVARHTNVHAACGDSMDYRQIGGGYVPASGIIPVNERRGYKRPAVR